MPDSDVTEGSPVITDDELKGKRDAVEQLRAELEQANADRLAREAQTANALVYDRLSAEEDRLKALLAAARGEQPTVGLDQVDAKAAEDQGAGTAEQVVAPAPKPDAPAPKPEEAPAAEPATAPADPTPGSSAPRLNGGPAARNGEE